METNETAGTATLEAPKGKKKARKSKGKAAVAAAVVAAAPASTKAPRITIEDNDSGVLVLDKYKCKLPKELRGESKRGKLLESLRSAKGITLAQGCSRFEWTPRDFADALRLLAKVNGVVTKRDENGHWHVESEMKIPAAAAK